MDQTKLKYKEFLPTLAETQQETGLDESAAFLYWFLINVYRLDETDARDSIFDKTNDKGIDAIYVDQAEQAIHFLQAKIRQKDNGTVGDVGPKTLVSSMHQFATAEKVDAIIAGNAAQELKQLLSRVGVRDLVEAGYTLRAIYVTNELNDADSTAYERLTDEIEVFDRGAIADHVIDVTPTAGKEEFTFDTSYANILQLSAGGVDSKSEMYVFPATALQLVHMDGISDGSLFEENVRRTLGNTAVNKSIRASIADKSTHPNFPLFHNGITILCGEAAATEGQLTIKNYYVVNGAQSLTSFFDNRSKLTDDLRVLVKVVALANPRLSRTITENSNNQNAIKPRDMRSNHLLMKRLQAEITKNAPGYFLEIKRGEKAPENTVSISNELAGRELLAFDLHRPWSAHQIYKVFDEQYAEIFGRREVTAARIVLIYKLHQLVEDAMSQVKDRPMATYALTQYFVLSTLAVVLRTGESARTILSNPQEFSDNQVDALLQLAREVLKTLVVDLDYHTAELPDFDYKSAFKSQALCEGLSKALQADYEKDAARDKAQSIVGWEPAVPAVD
ncbi:AIPR family protein [Rathayibacter iranicus]|uniref:Abortive phage infection protein C-terminal domain-containing protein n=2 Tax=Rathayibacter iranicus TaxID=59737 RepID=A0AAD1ELG5_9MICO|nr:AIPR family protein [Rathayibacter iranicus]AZZ55033.1 hypothetical protein C7V51_03370 [Rathayibacter iranicus]MWV32245.1 hypothetical protein [Rathayibacter iranicus NCPPB 2253 = VKM Ac-1602]PPI61941.1 hypothetical protein C5E08_03380 [Rathayibacter iranicus]PWJ59720.1 AIPR protein [Rathayibacter iranicus] [Rathayibacter iranicus NCPPB 2253 = VKM Ac-1602]